jgi:hypothetical protein
MSEPRARYRLTRADLSRMCPLLAKIEVLGHSSSVEGCQHVKGTERLVGRNHAGDIIVQTSAGTISNAKLSKFYEDYKTAVASGILKPQPEQEPHV